MGRLDDNRRQVVDNIRCCVQAGEFNSKVEPGDPMLDPEDLHRTLLKVVESRDGYRYRLCNIVARSMARYLTHRLYRTAEIVGIEKIRDIRGAAIVTSNHFGPFENGIIRVMTRRNGKGRLWAVSQDTNFAMKGWVGFLLKYTDLIPISHDQTYMANDFEQMLKAALDKGHYVLIYPEQEMWWNYRKPRPLKRGAYHYAAKMGVPVISCFVEMRDIPDGGIKHILHVLDPIYPDPAKSARDNSYTMMQTDYAQKKAAYEAAYGKPLEYDFEESDIAGIS